MKAQAFFIRASASSFLFSSLSIPVFIFLSVLKIKKKIISKKEKGFFIYAVMIGDGPSRSEIEKRAQEFGVAGQIKITGFINQKDKEL